MATQEYKTSAKRFSTFRLVSAAAILLCGIQALPCAAQVPLAAPTPSEGQPSANPPTAAVVLPSYRVNPGDLLDISVFEKPELSKQLLIPPDGKIQYAFVREFVAAQLTLGEIKDRLTTELSKQLNNPQVSVAIIKRQIQEVSVLGAVRTPGKRPLNDNWRILDLIADSGGLAVARPEWVNATLVRGGGAQAIPVDLAKLMSGSLEQNLTLAAGDVLLIREIEASRISLQVIGEVTRPGSVVVPPDGSFATVITAVGDFKPRASKAKVTLHRDGKDMIIDMREVLTTGKVLAADGTEIKAQAGDTLIVAPNKLTIAVLGAVNRPGLMEYPESGEVTILSALSMSGGANPAADLKNAVLVRPVSGGQPKGIALNLEDLIKKDNILKNSKDEGKGKDGEKNKTVNLVLQPGDYIFVPAKAQGRKNSFTDVLRSALTVLPIVNLITQ